MQSIFCCPICAGGLRRTEKQYVCPADHSFDIAREGYVNLLPANRQHSKAPGDDKDMAAARTRFLDGGWYAPLRDTLADLVEQHLPQGGSVLDVGCGEGYYTAALAAQAEGKGGRCAGVDLSKPAVKKAARRCPGTEIAVASVYHLPLIDEAVHVVADCFSPLAIDEFRRVLAPGGTFLYVVPGPRHLWEMKRVLYADPYENPDKREEYPGFGYVDVVPVETTFTLTQNADLMALFSMTPYAWKTPREGVERLAGLDTLTVTAQFRIHVLERK